MRKEVVSLRAVVIGALLVLLGGFGPANVAQAATFTVTKVTDEAPDGCTASDCSLREAVIEANAAAGDDIITLPAGTYTLTLAGTGEQAAATGDLDVTETGGAKLTINGAGAATSIIQAGDTNTNGIDRVFEVLSSANLTLSSVTIQNGKISGSGGGIFNNSGGRLTVQNSTLSSNSAFNGGGITSIGTLTVQNSTLSSNSASGSGGGIYNISGTATVQNSTLSSNSATGSGGGIYRSSGTVNVGHSILSTNSASSFGGGIASDDTSGKVTVQNSTLSSNSATNGGGGINNLGTVMVQNSTLSSNSATGSGSNGGGIYNSGTVTVQNSTLSSNSATNGGGITNIGTLNVQNSTLSSNSATNGGGLYNSNGGTVDVGNSILHKGSASGDNFSGAVTSQGHNISSDAAGGDAGTAPGGLLNQPGDLRNTDPKLDPLDDYGGPTKTHRLQSTSPAIDAGSNALALTVDQRGAPRPFDGDGNGTALADIGAYELGATPGTSSFIVNKTDDTADGACTASDCSLREAVIAANALGGDDIITLPAGTYTLTLAGTGEQAAATGDLDVTLAGGKLTINGAGAATTIIQAGTTGTNIQEGTTGNGIDRVFEVLSSANLALSSVTIRNGKTSGSGGGIFNNSGGTVTVQNSTLSSNSTINGNGGGILNNSGGTVTVQNSTLSSNSTINGIGGGILSSGTLNVINSTLSSNSARSGGGIYNNSRTVTVQNSTLSSNSALFGGGIYNSGGTVTVQNSTLSSNSTTNGGGGIYNSGGTLTVGNSTLSNNSATGTGIGGGILNNSSGTVTVQNSTLSSNSANNGGGINNGGGTVNVGNSIVHKGSASGDNFSGPVTSLGHNISSDGTGPNDGTTDKINTDPKLDPLDDYGGPTKTHRLQSNSPAINAGNNVLLPADSLDMDGDGNLTEAIPFDQRGTGFPRVRHTTVDIGAYEAQNLAPVATGPSSFFATAGVGVTLTLVGTDADGDALTYTITSLPANAMLYDGPSTGGTAITAVPYTLTDANHQVTYLALSTYTGADSFAFKVNHGTVDSAEKTVSGVVSAATGAIISEFRTRGPGGAGDEYVEIANTTAGPLNVSGWVLAAPNGASEAITTIPANTEIPKGGHLLLTGSTYSLGGVGGYATGDVTLIADLPDDGGVALRNASGTRQDAVGFAGADTLYKSGTGIGVNIAGNGQNAFMRQQRGTPYINTPNNASDFDFVTVTGGAVDGAASKLGAPGPEGLLSPTLRNDTLSAVALPVFRDTTATGTNANFGTIAQRYKVTNNGTQKITRLRFRAVMIPAGGGISGGSWQTANGTADLRLLTSANTTATINGLPVDILGSSLEQPPTQSNGGGLNSSMSLDLSGLPGGGIGPTETVNVQFTLGVVVKGTYRTVLNMEGLP